MSKLVRDGVEAHLLDKNPHIVFEEALPDMREPLVFSKLLEEAGEWLAARTREERLKELGDLVEVIWALGEIDGIGQAEIVTQAAGKRAARGSFDRLAVMKVETGGPVPFQSTSTEVHSSRPIGDGPWYSG